jgi:hypothetical protein
MTAGSFIGLNPSRNAPPLVPTPCNCRACTRLRAEQKPKEETK